MVTPRPIDDGAPKGFTVVSHKNRFRSGVELTTNAGGEVTWAFVDEILCDLGKSFLTGFRNVSGFCNHTVQNRDG
jgi:hypothetical protein